MNTNTLSTGPPAPPLRRAGRDSAGRRSETAGAHTCADATHCIPHRICANSLTALTVCAHACTGHNIKRFICVSLSGARWKNVCCGQCFPTVVCAFHYETWTTRLFKACIFTSWRQQWTSALMQSNAVA